MTWTTHSHKLPKNQEDSSYVNYKRLIAKTWFIWRLREEFQVFIECGTVFLWVNFGTIMSLQIWFGSVLTFIQMSQKRKKITNWPCLICFFSQSQTELLGVGGVYMGSKVIITNYDY